MRCFYLQVIRNEYYLEISRRQQRRWEFEKPQRGVILDCRGRLLAASNKEQSIFAEPRIIKDAKEVSSRLSAILDMPAHEICKIITESGNPGFVRIKTGADRKECEQAVKIYGIGVETSWQRYYPMGRLAGHVTGFVNAAGDGSDGTELGFNKQLAGTGGQNIYFADSRRRPVRLREQKGVLRDGGGIILTIDATIQQFARQELLKQYESFQAESAIAIVARPQSGEILAMVTLPDFDPDDIQPGDVNNLRNRALSDQFEPGSIIKPFAAAIALDSGVIEKDEKIFCENGDYRGKGFGRINEYRDHAFGNLSIREIIIKSSNIGMAKIGQKTGAEKLYQGLKFFGFGQKTGVELPGEAAGVLRPVDEWTGYSVTRIPYGYEISVTAMQIVRAYCILANGGHPVQPFVVRAMVDADGKIIELKQPQPGIELVIKPAVAGWIVKDPLVGVVNERKNGGTGWRAKLEKWEVFGKTGTANIARVNQKGYSKKSANLASFVAGGPAENPQVVVLVSVRKPNRRLGKGDSGGVVATPVAGKIIEKTLNYLEKTRR
ncbi:MAG: peptidoglycan D,D-transpeptidase FtsI family protein [Planctomycetota bacterium]